MALHPFLAERLLGRRLHARRRLPQSRERLQHGRRARQLHAQRVQAARGRVPRARAVRAPRRAVGARRLARGDAGRLLRLRHDVDVENRANYGFQQPYLGATLECFRRGRCSSCAAARADAVEAGPGRGDVPSVEKVYTPATLPGLGAQPVYCTRRARSARLARARARLRAARRLLRRHVHDYTDTRHAYGFNQVDYEAIQHIPILREAWVLSLHAMAQTTYDKTASRFRSS